MKTVYVAMSGGVDSSVAAGLLKQQGHRVIGVYMQNWTRPVGGVDCPWKQDLADAKAAAAVLGILFKVFNFEQEYKQKVVDVIVAEYQAGRTPNPDVLCNQDIKFKLFFEAALADGADLIATGHYSRTINGQLYAAIDQAKDQSYFLYRVTSAALNQTLFPLGELTKPEVRQLAKSMGLPTANKPDSQGICFVGEVGIKDFLRQYVSASPGPVIRISDRQVIGTHDGAIFYTIGQRQGLGIGGGKPFYVVQKNMISNTLFVTDDPADLALASGQFNLTDIHWVNHKPDEKLLYQIRTRYRADTITGHLKSLSSGYEVTLDKPDRAISPGQSAVIYHNGQVLGGGIVSLVKNPRHKLFGAKTNVKTYNKTPAGSAKATF